MNFISLDSENKELLSLCSKNRDDSYKATESPKLDVNTNNSLL